MSVLDQFKPRRRDVTKTEPTVQTPPKDPANLHPEVVDTLTRWHDTIAENTRLTAELKRVHAAWTTERQQLLSDLEVERRIRAELERFLDQERYEKQRHEEYSVAVSTDLESLSLLILKIRERTLKPARENPQPGPKVEDLEQKVSEIAAADIARKFGANNRPEEPTQ